MSEGGPYPRAVRVLAMAIVFCSALALFSNAASPREMDFISFWAAGKLSLTGNPLAAYDIAAHKQVQLAVSSFVGTMPFAYPPPFLLLATPLALLPYGLSAIVWMVGTFVLYVLAAQQASPQSGPLAAAFPPVAVNGMIGQNGLLTGAIFISGMSLLGRKPFQAGLLLGCLVIKPQLGLLLPVAFAAAGHWRAFAGAAASSIGLVIVSILLFGTDAYFAFARMLPLYGSIASDGLVGWHKMATVYASMRLAGASAPLAWSGHITIACAGTLSVWMTWRSDAELNAKTAVLAAASVLISPYVFMYDMALLLLPFLWLIRNGEDARLLAVLWCIPLVVTLQNWGFNHLLNPGPLLPIGLLSLVARRIRQPSGSLGPSTRAPILAEAASDAQLSENLAPSADAAP